MPTVLRRAALGLMLLLPSATPALSQGRLPADFVHLRMIEPGIQQDMRYAGANNFVGHSLPGYYAAECILRRGVALALKAVQADLARQGYSLKVYDCYRPARAVAAMARWAQDGSATPDTSRFYPGLKKNRLFALGYIASHSGHSRGVAVDLTIVPRNAPLPPYNAQARYGSCAGPAATRAPDNSLDMGTGFDCLDVKSHTYAGSISADERAHRRILLDAMARHGFRNYSREWWHFSYPAADTRAGFNFPVEAQ